MENIKIMVSVSKDELLKYYVVATLEERIALETFFGRNTFEPDLKVSIDSLQKTYSETKEDSVERAVLEKIYGKFLKVSIPVSSCESVKDDTTPVTPKISVKQVTPKKPNKTEN